MSWKSENIQNILLNSTAVKATISTFKDDTNATQYCIFNEMVLPEFITQKDQPKTINYYRSAIVNGKLSYGFFFYTINCRADTIGDAEAIQIAVFNAINRKSNDSVFFICDISPVIAPADATDNYNAPVEVQIKTRGL
jgi:hypothetical protein